MVPVTSANTAPDTAQGTQFRSALRATSANQMAVTSDNTQGMMIMPLSNLSSPAQFVNLANRYGPDR